MYDDLKKIGLIKNAAEASVVFLRNERLVFIDFF
jgi:hypothetical protein